MVTPGRRAASRNGFGLAIACITSSGGITLSCSSSPMTLRPIGSSTFGPWRRRLTKQNSCARRPSSDCSSDIASVASMPRPYCASAPARHQGGRRCRRGGQCTHPLPHRSSAPCQSRVTRRRATSSMNSALRSKVRRAGRCGNSQVVARYRQDQPRHAACRSFGTSQPPRLSGAADVVRRRTSDQAKWQILHRRHALCRACSTAQHRLPLGARRHSTRPQVPQSLHRPAPARPLPRACDPRCRRQTSQCRLRPAKRQTTFDPGHGQSVAA